MATIGVVLSGCGNVDGSEIHEATLTLLHLARGGAQVRCFAPEKTHFTAFDYVRKVATREERGVFGEAARIARGQLTPLSKAVAEELDGLILPGGQGAAKNLCDWIPNGPKARVDPELAALIRTLNARRKPLGFICIAPVIAALLLGEKGVRLTIGQEAQSAALIEQCGAVHVPCTVSETCLDDAQRVVSTPAYMLGPGITEIDLGIGKLVAQVLAFCSSSGARTHS